MVESRAKTSRCPAVGVATIGARRVGRTRASHLRCMVHAQGGDLQVEFARTGEHEFSEVKLIGPAVEVFKGEIEL